MEVLRITRQWRRKTATAALAALAALCFPACPSPLTPSVARSSGAAATLTVSFSIPSSRTVTASSDDFAASISALAVAIVDGWGMTVAEASGIAYGAGVVKSFGSLPPGTYTITANAYDAAGALIAAGSTSVAVAANANKSVIVDLAYGQDASTGAFSLVLSWPVSTGLAYVSAAVDGVAIAVPSVVAGAVNYSAILAASNLSGGAHLLSVYFRTAAGAPTCIGPFIETVNIWNGVVSAHWIDGSGNSVDTRSFSAAEFSSSNADLAGLTLAGTTLPGFSAEVTTYTLTAVGSATFSFAADSVSGSQDVAYTWNGIGRTWDTVGPGTFGSQPLAGGVGVNSLQIVVTAPDRHTMKTYTVTFTIVDAASLASALAADLSGSFILTENIDTTGGGNWTPIGSAASPFVGNFNGNGHTVAITISGRPTNPGFFGYIGAAGVVRGLTVAGTISCGSVRAGAVAGYSEGLVSRCASTADVSGLDAVGGLVGKNGNASGIIEYCYSSGTISAAGGRRVGGLVGENSTYATVRYCYSVSDVTGSLYVGGIVGFGSGTIHDSYARGSVTGTDMVGGLIGASSVSNITNCYGTGTSTGATDVGSFVGYDIGGTYTSCYAATAQTGYAEEMAVSLPSGWPTSFWGRSASINDGYPYLLYFGAGTQVP